MKYSEIIWWIVGSFFKKSTRFRRIFKFKIFFLVSKEIFELNWERNQFIARIGRHFGTCQVCQNASDRWRISLFDRKPMKRLNLKYWLKLRERRLFGMAVKWHLSAARRVFVCLFVFRSNFEGPKWRDLRVQALDRRLSRLCVFNELTDEL